MKKRYLAIVVLLVDALVPGGYAQGPWGKAWCVVLATCLILGWILEVGDAWKGAEGSEGEVGEGDGVSGEGSGSTPRFGMKRERDRCRTLSSARC